MPGGHFDRDCIAVSFDISVQTVPVDAEPLLLICSIDRQSIERKPVAGDTRLDLARIAEVAHELAITCTGPQGAIHNLESSGEEQKAIDAEALSASEGYQSLNGKQCPPPPDPPARDRGIAYKKFKTSHESSGEGDCWKPEFMGFSEGPEKAYPVGSPNHPGLSFRVRQCPHRFRLCGSLGLLRTCPDPIPHLGCEPGDPPGAKVALSGKQAKAHVLVDPGPRKAGLSAHNSDAPHLVVDRHAAPGRAGALPQVWLDSISSAELGLPNTSKDGLARMSSFRGFRSRAANGLIGSLPIAPPYPGKRLCQPIEAALAPTHQH